jgi:GGDEF domain-containing protein
MIAAMEERRVTGRPRPVADPVVAAVAAHPDEVAQRWLVALMESTPLDSASEIPVDALAQDGPVFCAAVLRAVGSDEALTALVEPGAPAPSSELMRLSGAADGPGAVAAAEALRRAIREAAAAELSYADSAVLVDLGDRLAHVCAHIAATAMAMPAAERRAAPPPTPVPEAEEERQEAAPEKEPPVREAPPAERAPAAEAAPLWLAALERQVAGGGRFGLLLVELDDAERLRLAEGPDAARELFARAARAVRNTVRRGDVLAHEEDGRIWLIAPDALRSGSASLGQRVAQAVEGAVASRGVPLTTSIGIALFPDDGRSGEELMAQAEEGAFAARAAGVRVAGEPDEPAASGPRLVP